MILGGKLTPITTFDPPLEVTIHFDPSSLGNIPEDSLRLYLWDADGEVWQDVVTFCASGEYLRVEGQHWLRSPLCHLGEFAILGDTLPVEPGIRIFLPLIVR